MPLNSNAARSSNPAIRALYAKQQAEAQAAADNRANNLANTTSPQQAAANEAQARKTADQQRRESIRAQSNDYRSERERDLRSGRKRGEELFGEGKLGRVNEASSPEMQALLAQRMQQSQGFSPTERNLLNAQYMGELGQQFAGQNLEARRLAQAGGLRGPAAAALAQRSLTDQAGARANLQRDLFLQEQGQARVGLDKYEGTLSAKEAKELEKQMFNLAQKNKEKLGVLGTEFGYAGLGSADRAAAVQQVVGAEQADALNKLASESGKK